MRYFIVIFISIVSFSSFSQSVEYGKDNEVLGYAPDFVGKKVNVYKIQDYVSMKRTLLVSATVNKKDSTFRMTIPNKGTQKVIIEIDDQTAELYIHAGTRYAFKFPKANEKEELLDLDIELTLIGIDSTDINYKIAAFDMWKDNFIYAKMYELMSKDFSKYVDTFKMYVADYYKNEDDLYFLSYVKFSLAELEQINQVQNETVRRFVIYMNYIRKQPILFGHDKYINFLKTFYDQQFKRYGDQIRNEIYNAIDQASPSVLDTVLKKDKLLENSLIREFAMVINLGKEFYENEYNPNNIVYMLDSIHKHPKYEKNGQIAGNLLSIIKSRTAGFPAPRFHVNDGQDTISNGSLRGKYVYLHFFTTWDEQAKKEIEIMKQMYEKYNKYVEFVSIAMDEDRSKFEKFDQTQNIKWPTIYLGSEGDIIDAYEVENTPTYFLIDPEGFLVQSPALRPSPDGEYETIDKTFYYIKKQMDPEESNGRSY